MTRNVTRCPECDGVTKLVDRQTFWNEEMRHIRVCRECPVEYEVSYGNPIIENVRTNE